MRSEAAGQPGKRSARAAGVRPFAVLVCLGLALLLALAMGLFQPPSSLTAFCQRTDFLGIYVGARCVATGQAAHLFDLQEQWQVMEAAIAPNQRASLMPFVYPGYVAVVLAPLGRLPYTTAYLTWFGVNLGAAAWMIVCLGKIFALTPGRGMVIWVCLAWLPLQLTLFQGQLGILVALGLTQSMIALDQERTCRAGAWLALGVLKPQLVLFPLLVFLLWGCWRGLAAFFAVALALGGSSTIVLGFWVPRYLHFLGEYMKRGAQVGLFPRAMQNWRGLVTLLLRNEQGPTVWALVALLTGVSLLVTIRVCWHASPWQRLKPWRPGYAIALVLGLLSSPHSYMHDWVVVLPAGLTLWAFGRECPLRSWSAKLPGLLVWAPAVFALTDFARPWVLLPIVPVYAGIVVLLAWSGVRRRPVGTGAGTAGLAPV